MADKQHKAIILTDWWAGVLGTLLCACILGGVSFAWNAHSETAVLQDQVDRIEQANLPSRLDKLEEKVDNTNDSLAEMKARYDLFLEMARER